MALGLHTGWVAPGRYRDRVLHMKYIATGSSNTLAQHALAKFIRQGHYQPHLRHLRIAGRRADL
nr:GntR family transcriptional regulator [Candidatus Pantoea persica]